MICQISCQTAAQETARISAQPLQNDATHCVVQTSKYKGVAHRQKEVALKSLLFCMKQNCLGLQYRDVSSRVYHFVMKPCLCVNISGICPFLLVTNFHIGNFFLRNENHCIPRCFISFLMQSRHLLSFLIVEPTLI